MGRYFAVCCETKYGFGTFWPRFYALVGGEASREHEKRTSFMLRIEMCCATCSTHLGQVSRDGPKTDRLALPHQWDSVEVRLKCGTEMTCVRGAINRSLR